MSENKRWIKRENIDDGPGFVASYEESNEDMYKIKKEDLEELFEHYKLCYQAKYNEELNQDVSEWLKHWDFNKI